MLTHTTELLPRDQRRPRELVELGVRPRKGVVSHHSHEFRPADDLFCLAGSAESPKPARCRDRILAESAEHRSHEDALSVERFVVFRCRIPEKMGYSQLETVITIVRFFEALSEKSFDNVVAFVKRHLKYLLGGLQRVLTNLWNNNQIVLLWYFDSGTCDNEDDRSIADAVSLFYQYLSLLSYSYDFSVVL